MNKLKLSLITLISSIALTFAPTANAQEFDVRAQGGATIPVTKPQSERFHAGETFAINPEIVLCPWFATGPKVGYTVLPSRIDGVNAGTALGVEWEARVQRPHNNTGKELAAASPWVGGELGYFRTGNLDRFGGGASVGVDFPTDDDKNLWLGPMASYQVIHQNDNLSSSLSSNSAKLFTIGLNIEYDFTKHRKVEQPKPVETKKVVIEEKKPEAKKPEVKEEPKQPEVMKFNQKVQFPFDSAALRPSENPALHQVLDAMLKDKDYSITIEGYASSEGNKEYNKKLSQRRAEAVMNWLAANGVDKNRMKAVGRGIENPVGDNKTEAGRVLNRRAEFDCTFTLSKQN